MATSLTDQQIARALARFRWMRHRGTTIGFEPVGPTVVASTPRELEQATADFLAARDPNRDQS